MFLSLVLASAVRWETAHTLNVSAARKLADLWWPSLARSLSRFRRSHPALSPDSHWN